MLKESAKRFFYYFAVVLSEKTIKFLAEHFVFKYSAALLTHKLEFTLELSSLVN